MHCPTAIVLQVILNHFIKRGLYISHGYKFPLKFALREPSPSGEGGGLPTDEGLNSLCHKPLTTAARSLSPGRSLSFVPWRLPDNPQFLVFPHPQSSPPRGREGETTASGCRGRGGGRGAAPPCKTTYRQPPRLRIPTFAAVPQLHLCHAQHHLPKVTSFSYS